MKTETYDYSTIDEAIERLQKLKAEGKNPKNVVILTMDFDNNTSSKKIATPDDGCLLVKKSKTIIMNEDEYIPHMQLFNTEQNIKNIIRRGIMHDIYYEMLCEYLFDFILTRTNVRSIIMKRTEQAIQMVREHLSTYSVQRTQLHIS